MIYRIATRQPLPCHVLIYDKHGMVMLYASPETHTHGVDLDMDAAITDDTAALYEVAAGIFYTNHEWRMIGPKPSASPKAFAADVIKRTEWAEKRRLEKAGGVIDFDW